MKTMKTMKTIASTVYILFLIMLTGSAVGAAAKAGYLIPAAVPFALVLILILRFMNPKLERIAWPPSRSGLEAPTFNWATRSSMGFFFAYIALALLGVFKSPYFLVAAWLLHPVWDFIPRELPELYIDLPMACILFDIPIGLYLLWASRIKRWTLLITA